MATLEKLSAGGRTFFARRFKGGEFAENFNGIAPSAGKTPFYLVRADWG